MSYYLYSFAWRVIRFLPESMAYRLGDWIARYAIDSGKNRITRHAKL